MEEKIHYWIIKNCLDKKLKKIRYYMPFKTKIA